MKTLDLFGKTFGRLTVVEKATHKNGLTRWICECECGQEYIAYTKNLRNHTCQSCGCIKQELLTSRNSSHHQSKSRTYNIWCGIKKRCQNKQSAGYKDYGGRGITIDPSWELFAYFLADMGECPPGAQIDRIDNNAGYTKDNCRWTNRSTNGRNKRTSSLVTLNGVTKHILEWAKDYPLPTHTIQNRYSRGVRGEALFKPLSRSKS